MKHENHSDIERFAQRLEEFQKQYFTEVDIHFRNNNRTRGVATFTNWELAFIHFLEIEIPGYFEEYKRHLASNSEVFYIPEEEIHQSWKRKRGKAVESFLEKSILNAKTKNLKISVENSSNDVSLKNNQYFVNEARINQLRMIDHTRMDLSRLIRFCEELNICFSQGCLFAISLLTRSLLDHVLPIFGMDSFTKVARSFPESQSSRMLKFDQSSREIAYDSLYGQIRTVVNLITPNQVNFSQDLDVLLEEIVKRFMP